MSADKLEPVVTTNIPIGRYRHFRGDEIEVLGTCFHSESLEEFVVYKHITGQRADEPYYWVRPKQMFLETVEVLGKAVPRFEYLG